jgi:hypothetical protein
MLSRRSLMQCAVAVALVALFVDSSSQAALSRQGGGAGYSGTLSRNRAIRKQQLICDPATGGGGSSQVSQVVNPQPDAPVAGSTSVTYDPSIVHLSGFLDGPSYGGSGVVAVDTGEGIVLEDIALFVEMPFGQEVGYVQWNYERPFVGEAPAGQLSPPAGYTIEDNAGVSGFDTHALFFDYLEGVSDNTVATYKIFAAKEGQFYGNAGDFLVGTDADGNSYALGPDQLLSATVRGSLAGPISTPLPPAAPLAAATIAGFALIGGGRRLVRRLA